MDNRNLQPAGTAPGYMLWLILGIVQTISTCCCCGGCISLVFGILTMIFAVQANGAFKVGDVMKYKSKINTAKIINIVGWVLTVGLMILGMVTGLAGAILEELGIYL